MTLHRRQQGGSSASSASSASAQSNSASSGSASSASLTDSSASGSASAATTHFGITGGPGYNASAQPTTTVGANGDPGEIVITKPPPQSTSYYKIAQGEYVTIGWNFSYLVYTPTAITVAAACENGNTYPVGPSNGVIAGDAQSVEWYPYGWQTDNPNLPLAQADYTLQIYAAGGPSAAATPGFLAPNDQLQFALYTPQPYTPLASGWSCAGCGGALEQFKAHPASIALVTTLLVVFLSGFSTLRRVWY